MDLEQARFNMIEQQIRPWFVDDVAVLELLSKIKREDFVPDVYKTLAFADIEIPIACGQVMLYPKVQARILQDLQLKGDETVLEIGTGSGYLTALLASQAKHVTSLEIERDLVELARANIAKVGIKNADCLHVDASKDKPVSGEFDVIVLGGSLSQIPQNLISLLKIGGRMLGAIGSDIGMEMSLFERTGQTECVSESLWEINLPRLKNFGQKSQFTF